MIVDAIKREAPFYWFLIIIFIPFGQWIYFFMVKIQSFESKPLRNPLAARGPSIKELRYNYNKSKSVLNKVLLAQALCRKKEYEEAAKLFEEVIAFDKENKEALHGLGRCKMGMKAYDEAEKYLKKVIELEKSFENYEPWIDLANVLWLSEQKDDTIQLLRELVQSSPRIGHETILAEHLIKVDKKGEAREILEGILEDYKHEPSYAKKTNRQWIRKAKHLLKTI
jgi:hypothetical protein